MNGKILAFSVELGAGLIRCDGKQHFIFRTQDWSLETPPANDMLVEFEPRAGHALKVKPVPHDKVHVIRPRIEPWLRKEEYDVFKRLAPDDPTLPVNYDEWLEKITELVSVFIKCGVLVEKIHINAHEFEKYCTDHNINPDGVGRAAFAVYKARNQTLKK
jgi:hypothetical protein